MYEAYTEIFILLKQTPWNHKNILVHIHNILYILFFNTLFDFSNVFWWSFQIFVYRTTSFILTAMSIKF